MNTSILCLKIYKKPFTSTVNKTDSCFHHLFQIDVPISCHFSSYSSFLRNIKREKKREMGYPEIEINNSSIGTLLSTSIKYWPLIHDSIMFKSRRCIFLLSSSITRGICERTWGSVHISSIRT